MRSALALVMIGLVACSEDGPTTGGGTSEASGTSDTTTTTSSTGTSAATTESDATSDTTLASTSTDATSTGTASTGPDAGEIGADCTEDVDCNSGVCWDFSDYDPLCDGAVCSVTCTRDSDCVEAFTAAGAPSPEGLTCGSDGRCDPVGSGFGVFGCA